jgi:hypothetical protein
MTLLILMELMNGSQSSVKFLPEFSGVLHRRLEIPEGNFTLSVEVQVKINPLPFIVQLKCVELQ